MSEFGKWCASLVGVVAITYLGGGCHDDDDHVRDHRDHHERHVVQRDVVVEQPPPQPVYQQPQPVYEEPTIYEQEQPVVYVQQAPPPVIVERVPPPPRPGYVWAAGYYRPHGDRWTWVHGHYYAPRPGYVYVAPRSVHSHRGYEYHAAVWRKK